MTGLRASSLSLLVRYWWCHSQHRGRRPCDVSTMPRSDRSARTKHCPTPPNAPLLPLPPIFNIFPFFMRCSLLLTVEHCPSEVGTRFLLYFFSYLVILLLLSGQCPKPGPSWPSPICKFLLFLALDKAGLYVLLDLPYSDD